MPRGVARHPHLVPRRRSHVAGGSRARGVRGRARRPARARPRLRPGRLQPGARRARLRLPRRSTSSRSTWRPRAGSACAPTATTAARAAGRRRGGHRDPDRGARAPRGPRRRAARGRPRGGANVLVTTPNCTQSFERGADRVQPHAGRGPPPVLHRRLAARAAGGAVRALRGRAEPPARRDDRERGAAAPAAADLPHAWRAPGKAPPRFFSRLLGQGWVGGAA